jgi:hypothetical protein
MFIKRYFFQRVLGYRWDYQTHKGFDEKDVMVTFEANNGRIYRAKEVVKTMTQGGAIYLFPKELKNVEEVKEI